MGKIDLNKFIIFMFVYILIIFPLALFTEEELFPFSRFPMYAQNSLNPCGYSIHLYKNHQAVPLGRSRVANLFLKSSQDMFVKQSNSEAHICQFIREVFWPKKIPHESFYVTTYCTVINKLPSLVLNENIVLTCY